MNTRPVVERLAALPDLAGVPREQAEWLLAHAGLQHLDDGTVLRGNDDLTALVDPFFATKDVSQGRGLGLDIVRTVVRTHRGTVDLGCEPGRTEFRVTLPAAGAVT